MKWPEIQNPDLHYINAATGWLELGAPDEALAEIEKLDFLVRYHPDVLIVRWKVSARMRRWEQALDLARSMVKIAPDRPAGWICLSHRLYNNQRTLEALTELQVAARRFPSTSAIFYFLARLSCRLGHNAEAKMWLTRWKDMVDETAIRNTVNDDPTLAPIWKELGISVEAAPQADRAPTEPPSLVPANAKTIKRG
jgi:tetratricopeptide (TPR) repeat protein